MATSGLTQSTLGTSWLQDLEAVERTPNQLPQPDEEAASAFFDDLKASVIPGCIPGAVSAGSNEIILDAPISAIGTKSFERFVSWARNQDMDARFGGIVLPDDKQKEMRAAIRLSVA
ncbi:hypothetical protein [uncultured Brevundimonas sp.]|uniref:hypothetical protein n=1 Tax=uncultured Brevundimonas sp. TaxID=213418 RepID=UPI0025913022|nr:hypothetical protein [uncultured Brevundimonas sp.]